jgi:ubiquinone/menaquinone biosynthesis C-methylase UbiE
MGEESERMYGHFSAIATAYRGLRTTDMAPVRFIAEQLVDYPAITAADIGCGAGRYDLLLFRHLSNLRLICIDMNSEMLAQLSRHLAENGIQDFETLVAGVEEMRIDDASLDCVFTFNAVHHFDFPTFLSKAGRAIRKNGEIFIYTRTPDQNSRSIWGQHFPDFCSKERRLFDQEQMETWVDEAEGLRLITVKTFRYRRTSSPDRLLAQVLGKHYSTFSLYTEEEFERALGAFEAELKRRVRRSERVEWYDENVMLRIRRTDT